ncbi:family 43 glycosylhydrolase [Schaalia sp. ZJ1691]|uniref:family 43 glycosylhydrolase n=1 Tax=Schaalia sp. ZJ1691 TaxID=2709404 RepID=UPI0013ED3C0F|nr:family 43 glycosylhydrolase [Schaalia sp. ZJ1691]
MRTYVAAALTAVLALVMLASGNLVAWSVDTGLNAPEPTRHLTTRGNPIIADGSLYTADAATYVENGRLYVYAGHDEAAPDYGSFNMRDYAVLVTDDPQSGEWDVYERNLVPGKVFEWATGNGAYAGVVAKGFDGKYYWYTPVETKATDVPNRMAIGVAVADSPVGPWTDAKGSPVLAWRDVFGEETNGQEIIDPHVMIEDHHVYLYWGSWNVARMVELQGDMVTPTGPIHTMEGLDGFFEAPWIFKRGDTYHMVYDWKKGGSQCTPSNYQACIGHATAKNPKGPWTFQGIILPATSATTMHPSIIEDDGQWWMTYHTKDAKGGGHFRRSVAIDKVEWDGDQILPVIPTRLDDPRWRLTCNIALDAEVSASYTEQSPMRVGALNDGRVTTAMLPSDQWGNYRGTDSIVESDWVMYQWSAPTRVAKMGIEFHRDGNWIRAPKSWGVEYRDGEGEWRAVTGLSGTPTQVGVFHEVSFDPVTTDALRLTVHGQPEGGAVHSVSISEWEVCSAPGGMIPDVRVETMPGKVPILPEVVTVTYPDGGSGKTTVQWESVSPRDSQGEYQVRGRAAGIDSGYLKATVIVTDTPTAAVEDSEKPEIILAVNAVGAEGWYSGEVPMRVLASDNTDPAPSISVTVDDQEVASSSISRVVDFAVKGGGEHVIRAVVKDAAGNIASTAKTIRIDDISPTLDLVLNERDVSVSTIDEQSGIASIRGRFDNGTSFDIAADEIIHAPDGFPHRLTVTVTDRAGNSSSSSITIPLDNKVTLSGNLAPYAKASASFTSGWESVDGLNDGTGSILGSEPNTLNKSWGTWSQVGEQTAQLTWPFEVNVDKVGVWWYRNSPDENSEGMIPPKTWKLQYLHGEEWEDVSLTEGKYGRSSESYEIVSFNAVTTTALRIVAQAWGEHDGGGSIGIHEWQVIASEQTDETGTSTDPTVPTDPTQPTNPTEPADPDDLEKATLALPVDSVKAGTRAKITISGAQAKSQWVIRLEPLDSKESEEERILRLDETAAPNESEISAEANDAGIVEVMLPIPAQAHGKYMVTASSGRTVLRGTLTVEPLSDSVNSVEGPDSDQSQKKSDADLPSDPADHDAMGGSSAISSSDGSLASRDPSVQPTNSNSLAHTGTQASTLVLCSVFVLLTGTAMISRCCRRHHVSR